MVHFFRLVREANGLVAFAPRDDSVIENKGRMPLPDSRTSNKVGVFR